MIRSAVVLLLLNACANVRGDDPDASVGGDGNTQVDASPIVCPQNPSPGWQKLGNPVKPLGSTTTVIASRVTANSDGEPVIGVLHGNPRTVQGFRFDGSEWIQLGAPMNVQNGTAFSARVAKLDGQVYASFVEPRGGNGSGLYVYRWNPNEMKWLNISGDLSATSTESSGHEMTAHDGALYIVSTQTVSGTSGDRRIVVQRVNKDGSFVTIGSPFGGDNGDNPRSADIGIDSTGRIIVPYWENGIVVKEFTGSSWSNIGTGIINPAGISNAHGARITIDANDIPYVAVNDRADSENANSIYVVKWVNAQWKQVGQPLNENPVSGAHSYTARLIIDHEQRPVMAWLEGEVGGMRRMYVARFENDAWTLLADLIAYPDGKAAVNADVYSDGCGLIASFSQSPTTDNYDAEVHVYRSYD